jgi:hypothetical protein
MTAPKGKLPPAAGKGRPKGALNKTTAALKDMILQALDNKGGVKYLETQAEANPTAFLSLIGKVLPTTLHGAGADGEHKIVKRIEVAIVDPQG